MQFPVTAYVDESFLNRLGILEAIVEREASDEKSSHPPIFRLPVNLAWTEEQSQPLHSLQESLGDRKSRQVLAECCRIAQDNHAAWSALAEQCVEALSRFSITGKGKTKLKEFRRELIDWELEGSPLLMALAAGLRPTIPDDLLVKAAQALAVAENLDQQGAVGRVRSVAANLSSAGW